MELPKRLIDLYTYKGDLVLDPFMGSGTTAVAAVQTERHYIGFDVEADYIEIAGKRVAEAREQIVRRTEARVSVQRAAVAGQAAAEGRSSVDSRNAVEADRGDDGDGGQQRSLQSGRASVSAFGVPAPRGGGTGDGMAGGDESGDGRTGLDGMRSGVFHDDEADVDFQSRAVREGRKAREMARVMLVESGFKDISDEVNYSACGVRVNFEAVDQQGRAWLFDVSGAFTVTKRPGLRRTDTLWKALGKAAVLHSFMQCRSDSMVGRRPEGAGRDPTRSGDESFVSGEGSAGAGEGSDASVVPLVLLTTDKPTPRSVGDRALKEVTGPGKPIRDVIKMGDRADMRRLREFAHGSAPV